MVKLSKDTEMMDASSLERFDWDNLVNCNGFLPWVETDKARAYDLLGMKGAQILNEMRRAYLSGYSRRDRTGKNDCAQYVSDCAPVAFAWLLSSPVKFTTSSKNWWNVSYGWKDHLA